MPATLRRCVAAFLAVWLVSFGTAQAVLPISGHDAGDRVAPAGAGGPDAGAASGNAVTLAELGAMDHCLPFGQDRGACDECALCLHVGGVPLARDAQARVSGPAQTRPAPAAQLSPPSASLQPLLRPPLVSSLT